VKNFFELFLILQENQISFPKQVLNLMNRRLNALGYGMRGSEDVLNILKKGTVYRNGEFINPDWKEAYEAALNSINKQSEKKVSQKQLMPHVNFKLLKSFGKTANPVQAGYIHPDGSLINLSGGDPYGRGIDHRIIGGFAAIQEIGTYGGYIRYMPEGGGFEIRKTPTSAQFRQIASLIDYHNGEVSIDLYDGKDAEWNEREGRYFEPNRSLHELFPKGTKPIKVLNKIRQFFS